jgi:hypothetical protein
MSGTIDCSGNGHHASRGTVAADCSTEPDNLIDGLETLLARLPFLLQVAFFFEFGAILAGAKLLMNGKFDSKSGELSAAASKTAPGGAEWRSERRHYSRRPSRFAEPISTEEVAQHCWRCFRFKSTVRNHQRVRRSTRCVDSLAGQLRWLSSDLDVWFAMSATATVPTSAFHLC